MEGSDEDHDKGLPLSKGKENTLSPRIARLSTKKTRKNENSGSSGDSSDVDELMFEAESIASDRDVFEEPKKVRDEPSKNVRDVKGAQRKGKEKGEGQHTGGRREITASKEGFGKGRSISETLGVIKTLVGQVSARAATCCQISSYHQTGCCDTGCA